MTDHDPHAYEAEQRRRIAQTDWGRLHRQTATAATLQTASPRTGPVNRFKQSDGVRRWRGGYLQEDRL